MVKRTQYLVAKREQLRFVGLIIIAFIVLLGFMLWNMHSLLSTIMPAGILAASKKYIITFVIGSIIITGVTAMVIIRYTHRFFGPMPRLKRELAQMAEENRYWELRIRDGDSMSELVESINLIIRKLMVKQ